MYCPMSSFLNFAYLYKYYPENFRYMLEKNAGNGRIERERAW